MNSGQSGHFSVIVLSSQLNLLEKLKAAEEQSVGMSEAESAESLEDVRLELQRRDKALKTTQEERDTLLSELDELDRQNQEATQV